MDVEMISFIKQSVLLVFFVFFAGVVWWAVSMPHSEAEAMRHLPLASDETSAENGGRSRA
jgi:hypothetical protein